jgi:hypothetical protein
MSRDGVRTVTMELMNTRPRTMISFVHVEEYVLILPWTQQRAFVYHVRRHLSKIHKGLHEEFVWKRRRQKRSKHSLGCILYLREKDESPNATWPSTKFTCSTWVLRQTAILSSRSTYKIKISSSLQIIHVPRRSELCKWLPKFRISKIL